ncbi:MAG: putative quinol monooxygenase [Rubripirellula sp.]
MYVVTVEFEISPGYGVSFRDAMLKQAENSLRQETGCRQFDVCFDPECETYCFLYERYDHRQAFDTHLKSQHFRNFDAIVRPWITNKTVKTLVDGAMASTSPPSSEFMNNEEN